MIERIGLDHTRQRQALSEDGVDAVRRIADNDLPGVDPKPGWLHRADRNADAMRGGIDAAALDRRRC